MADVFWYRSDAACEPSNENYTPRADEVQQLRVGYGTHNRIFKSWPGSYTAFGVNMSRNRSQAQTRMQKCMHRGHSSSIPARHDSAARLAGQDIDGGGVDEVRRRWNNPPHPAVSQPVLRSFVLEQLAVYFVADEPLVHSSIDAKPSRRRMATIAEGWRPFLNRGNCGVRSESSAKTRCLK